MKHNPTQSTPSPPKSNTLMIQPRIIPNLRILLSQRLTRLSLTQPSRIRSITLPSRRTLPLNLNKIFNIRRLPPLLIKSRHEVNNRINQFHLTLNQNNMLSPFFHRIHLNQPLTSKPTFNPLRTTFLKSSQTRLNTILFRHTNSPITSPNGNRRLPIIRQQRNTTMVRRPTSLQTRHRNLILRNLPHNLISIVKSKITIRRTSLTRIQRIPIRVPSLTNRLKIPRRIMNKHLNLNRNINIMNSTRGTRTHRSQRRLSIRPITKRLLRLKRVLIRVVINQIRLISVTNNIRLLSMFNIKRSSIRHTKQQLQSRPRRIITTNMMLKRRLSIILNLRLNSRIKLNVTMPNRRHRLNHNHRNTTQRRQHNRHNNTHHRGKAPN